MTFSSRLICSVFLASIVAVAAPAAAQEEPAADVPYQPDCAIEWRVTHEMMGLWFHAITAQNCEMAGQRGPICTGPLDPQVMEVQAYLGQLEMIQPEGAKRPDFDTYVREANLLEELQDEATFNERMNAEMNAQTTPPVLMQRYAAGCPQEAPEE